MQILCQQNHLWASDFLGSSKLTIGLYGCGASCLAMINNRFGANCTPLDVAKRDEWFTPDGLILWSKLDLKNAVFDSRDHSVNFSKIRAYLADPEKAVMVVVQLPKGGTHWMLVDAEEPAAQALFMCDDPWSGLQKLSDHYGPVIGAAFFTKRTPALP